jgi:hypothetical protein
MDRVESFPQFFGGFALSLTVSKIILTERGRKCESFYFSSNFNAVFLRSVYLNGLLIMKRIG